MVIDTSVLLHVFFEEQGWDDAVAYLLQQSSRKLSASSLVEAQAVIAGRTTADPRVVLDRLLRDLRIDVVAFSADQAELARDAYLRYGKGRSGKAGLNYGDVMSYALSKVLDEPLAFVGDDFNHTDLDVVRFPLG